MLTYTHLHASSRLCAGNPAQGLSLLLSLTQQHKGTSTPHAPYLFGLLLPSLLLGEEL